MGADRFGRTVLTLAAATATLLGGGCAGPPATPDRPAQPSSASPSPPPTTPPATPSMRPSPAEAGANELGEIPVLMYHRIVPDPDSVYDRSPQDFRGELERLAREDYVPVTAEDYAAGRIDIPAGTHPVVLTFDDGSPTQFSLDGNGNPAPETAVRILLDVAGEHPGFRPVATFFVNEQPFGEVGGRTSLIWLHEHGFEIGNHTLTHANLGSESAAGVQHEIAAMQRTVTDVLPGSAPRTLALPLGVPPSDPRLAVDGAADGVVYHHDAVFLVGAGPAPSPFAVDFDPANVPRIRSQAATGPDARFCSTAWLDVLAADPARRYTSGGDPGQISFPAGAQSRLADRFTQHAQPY